MTNTEIKHYTNNLRLDYMLSQQVSKDVIFNEAINKIDSMIYQSVFNFTYDLSYTNPDHYIDIKELLQDGKHFIISDHEKKLPDRIYYLPHAKENISFIEVRNGMLIYVQEKESFYLYKGHNHLSKNIFSSWQRINNNFSQNNILQIIHDDYYKIQDTHNMNATHIMLQRSTKFDVELEHANSLHLFIWYNSEANHKISWPSDILWNDKNHDVYKELCTDFAKTAQSSDISEEYIAPNKVISVKLYRIPQMNLNNQFVDANQYRFLGSIEDHIFQI